MKLRRIGRKADLSLSINAIVILILAITMLGLGLAFLRGTFKKTTEQFAEVSGTVKEQIVDEIKSKGEKLFVRGSPSIDIKRGETKDVYYGIKNVLDTEPSSTFTIATSCSNGIGGGNAVKLVLSHETTKAIKPGEYAVMTLIIKSDSDTDADTYPCSMTVTTGAGDYSVNDFYVKVSTGN